MDKYLHGVEVLKDGAIICTTAHSKGKISFPAVVKSGKDAKKTRWVDLTAEQVKQMMETIDSFQKQDMA